jgi:transcription termination/antitermination protein NusG
MIPGVTSVVSVGGIPSPIPEEEILALQRVVNSGMKYGPWSQLSEMGAGQAVQVKVGPLRGLKGVIVRVKDNRHLVISVAMIQRYVSVEIDRDSVMPIGKDQPTLVA